MAGRAKGTIQQYLVDPEKVSKPNTGAAFALLRG
jgi:hypothetical protein